MDSFSANYIKPRGSNLKNMNASIITNKRQAQMVFTGYERQIEAINTGFRTQRGAIAFNGAEGPTLANLKNGNTWTSPETLHAIQTTNYCSLSDSCPIPPPPSPPVYTISCSDVQGIQYITLSSIIPFYISYDTNISNTGVVQLSFYQTGNPSPIGIQVVNLITDSLLITPPPGTTSNNIGYVFRCTPILISYSGASSGSLVAGYPYEFRNDSGNLLPKILTITKEDSSTIVATVADGDTYTPSPLYGYISYNFN